MRFYRKQRVLVATLPNGAHVNIPHVNRWLRWRGVLSVHADDGHHLLCVAEFRQFRFYPMGGPVKVIPPKQSY